MTALATTAQIRALQATRRNAGLSDDDWHDRLATRYGVTSTKALTVIQANAELDSLKGSAPERRPGGRVKLSGPYAGKLQALWIGAWNLGIVRERDDAALIAFVRRQTGIDHVRWVRDAEDAAKAIEALKGWMAREADIDWSPVKGAPAWYNAPQYRIASAQWRILCALDRQRPEPRWSRFPNVETFLATTLDEDFRLGDAPAALWRQAMNHLGGLIRDLKGA
ncbi:regulatory protein GemA [Pleomorphomonas carboxyditropha]|uniref:GemA protein n=1 Tax=Pleomorphomonas carboxyditropha TaxID=2023338 RepID=A0A2G9WV71_9HYPH|nr:regulatory protein GemA [Pleomorphomonas carboxyditropha]PIO98607.1 hypothetical protein CJ014_14920 [Pleomorphomonas carboxyditropha]